MYHLQNIVSQSLSYKKVETLSILRKNDSILHDDKNHTREEIDSVTVMILFHFVVDLTYSFFSKLKNTYRTFGV